jgi:hypothetical protein
MTKPRKKLLLDRQTLRTLSAEELDVQGDDAFLLVFAGIQA